MFYPDRIRSIKPTDNVLEIGPGSNPHPRANIYLDKKFETDDAFRQAGSIKPAVTDMKTIFYEDYPFPFEDKEFDYIICSQVLEHIPDIDIFIKELCRIGKRGYLEFPTIYYDYLHNFDVHKTFLLFNDGVLKWKPKEETTLNEFLPVQSFFYSLLELGMYDFINKYKLFLFQGFEWEGEVVAKRTNNLLDICYSKEFIINNTNRFVIESLNVIETGNANRIKKILKKVLQKTGIIKTINTLSNKKISNGNNSVLGNTDVFKTEYDLLVQLSKKTKKRFILETNDIQLCTNDKSTKTPFDTHYVYHLAWAARILKQINPDIHTDISSSLHFCTIVSAFFKIEFYDYRPASIFLDNLKTNHADLTNLKFSDNSIRSLSCMHTVEHIGLGRYGDPIDYDGDLKAINELKRVLAVNGNLLFVVPIGKSKIKFNAHRIYSYEQVLSYFSDLSLIEFSLIPDNAIEAGMIINANKEISDNQSYACGCFWFQKQINV